MNAKIDAVQARDPGEWVSGRSVSGLNPVSARFGQNPGPFQQAIRNEAPGTAGFLEWGDEFVSLLIATWAAHGVQVSYKVQVTS